MDNNFVLDIIDNYFKQLYSTGSTSLQTQRKMLILTHIQEMLCSIFMNEEDYKAIFKYLENIFGDCLIPYPSYRQFINDNPMESRLKARSSEDGVIRVDHGKNVRVALD